MHNTYSRQEPVSSGTGNISKVPKLAAVELMLEAVWFTAGSATSPPPHQTHQYTSGERAVVGALP